MITRPPFEFAPVVPSGANMPAMPAPVRPPVNFAGAMVIAGGLVVWPAPPMPQPLPGSHETGEVAPSTAFTNLAEVASGGLEFRLVIEGIDTVFVTNEDMAGTDSVGRFVVPGLSRENLGFTERVYIASAEHEVQIDGVNIDEVGGEWAGEATRVFSTIATRVVGLSQTLGVGGTMKIPSGGGALLTVGEHYYLGTETVKVSSIDATGSPEEVVLARGEWSSTAQEHPVSTGATAMVTSLYNAPTGMHGRRVWLYAHTANELSPVATGTIVWRGILSREPTLSDDALSWSLGVEPRTKALDASLAGGFDTGFALRGIYYPGTSPLRLVLVRYPGATKTGTRDTETVYLSGFFEDQTSFADALREAIDTVVTAAGWAETFDVRAFPDTWDLVYTTTGTPRYIGIDVTSGSFVDGWFLGHVEEAPAAGIPTAPGAGAGGGIDTVAASTTYVFIWDPGRARGPVPIEDQRRVPRSCNVTDRTYVDSDASMHALWPAFRLYFGSIGALAAGDEITIGGATDRDGHSVSDDTPPQIVVVARVIASVSAVEAQERDDYFDVTLTPRVLAAGTTQPTLTGSARYAGGDGDLADLLDDLVARAPVLANRGKAPWLTDDDVADWHEAVTEVAGGRAWLDHRAWTFAKPVKAIEVMAEEWKLYGLIPYLNADAKLAVRPFTAGGDAIEMAIGPDDIFADETLGNVSGEADGIYTVVNVLRGYDPVEDKHQEGAEVTYRGLEAIARLHAERVLEIAPKSRAVGTEPDHLDLFDRGRSIISLFGDRRTQVVSFDVSLAAFGLLIGDTVSVTIAALPSNGYRTEWTPGSGMIARVGTLIGRSWDLGAGVGNLTVLLHELDLAGYAPCAKVDGASGAGTSWTLQVTQSHYSEGTDSTYFSDGMSVRLVGWDGTTREGVVVGTPGATSIVVSLATSWSGPAGYRYTLLFDTSDDAQTTEAQLAYCYQASAFGRIPLASGSDPAKAFAP